MVFIRTLLGGASLALLASMVLATPQPGPEARALQPKRPAAATAKDNTNPNALKIFGVFPVVNVGFDMKDGGLRGYMSEPLELRMVGHNLKNDAVVTFKTDPADCKKPEVASIATATIQAVTDDRTTGKLKFHIEPKGVYYMCYQKANGWGPLMDHWTGTAVRLEIADPAEEHNELVIPQWVVACIALTLLCMSGLFSGLNLGLLALDPEQLKEIMHGDDTVNAKYASRVYPLRKRGNLLLCTILIGNVSVNSTLSVVLDEFTAAGGVWTVVMSTCFITFFGEIIPQSYCMKHALFVGGHVYWICWFFVILLCPITYPVSLLLDRFIGDMEAAGKDDLKKTRDSPEEGVWSQLMGNGHRYEKLDMAGVELMSPRGNGKAD